jgi:hypothetical protein
MTIIVLDSVQPSKNMAPNLPAWQISKPPSVDVPGMHPSKQPTHHWRRRFQPIATKNFDSPVEVTPVNRHLSATGQSATNNQSVNAQPTPRSQQRQPPSGTVSYCCSALLTPTRFTMNTAVARTNTSKMTSRIPVFRYQCLVRRATRQRVQAAHAVQYNGGACRHASLPGAVAAAAAPVDTTTATQPLLRRPRHAW